jgi:hypothetical protein
MDLARLLKMEMGQAIDWLITHQGDYVLVKKATDDTRHKPYYEYPDGTPAKMKPVYDCSEYHKLNQDKDGGCPYCSKPINDDF